MGVEGAWMEIEWKGERVLQSSSSLRTDQPSTNPAHNNNNHKEIYNNDGIRWPLLLRLPCDDIVVRMVVWVGWKCPSPRSHLIGRVWKVRKPLKTTMGKGKGKRREQWKERVGEGERRNRNLPTTHIQENTFDGTGRYSTDRHTLGSIPFLVDSPILFYPVLSCPVLSRPRPTVGCRIRHRITFHYNRFDSIRFNLSQRKTTIRSTVRGERKRNRNNIYCIWSSNYISASQLISFLFSIPHIQWLPHLLHPHQHHHHQSHIRYGYHHRTIKEQTPIISMCRKQI